MGQELIIRTKHQGEIRHRLFPMFADTSPDTEPTSSGLREGGFNEIDHTSNNYVHFPPKHWLDLFNSDSGKKIGKIPSLFKDLYCFAQLPIESFYGQAPFKSSFHATTMNDKKIFLHRN